MDAVFAAHLAVHLVNWPRHLRQHHAAVPPHAYRDRHYPAINRRVTRQEFAQAVQWARDAGLTNLQSQ